LQILFYFWLSLAMLSLGERKGEKRVWDVGRWWVGVSDVVVMVGWKGGKMKKRWLEVSLILV
jgi:hypothetical protein